MAGDRDTMRCGEAARAAGRSPRSAPPPQAARSTTRPARWVRCAERRIAKMPTPVGAEMGKRLRRMRSATIPPARESQVARTETSPGSGPAARLPGFPVALSRTYVPVTVAGPRRTHTGFREPRSLERRGLVYGGKLKTARETSEERRLFRLTGRDRPDHNHAVAPPPDGLARHVPLARLELDHATG